MLEAALLPSDCQLVPHRLLDREKMRLARFFSTGRTATAALRAQQSTETRRAVLSVYRAALVSASRCPARDQQATMSLYVSNSFRENSSVSPGHLRPQHAYGQRELGSEVALHARQAVDDRFIAHKLQDAQEQVASMNELHDERDVRERLQREKQDAAAGAAETAQAAANQAGVAAAEERPSPVTTAPAPQQPPPAPSATAAEKTTAEPATAEPTTAAVALPAAGDPAQWSVGQVLGWLDAVGLGTHRPEFDRLGIDGPTLPELDDQDLADELGVYSRVQRKKILKRIAMLTCPPVVAG